MKSYRVVGPGSFRDMNAKLPDGKTDYREYVDGDTVVLDLRPDLEKIHLDTGRLVVIESADENIVDGAADSAQPKAARKRG